MNDLIRREDAIKAVIKLCEHYTSTKSVTHPHVDFVIREINALPAVDPVKHGKWRKYDIAMWRCSICGKIQIADDINELNYCCNCGAKNGR